MPILRAVVKRLYRKLYKLARHEFGENDLFQQIRIEMPTRVMEGEELNHTETHRGVEFDNGEADMESLAGVMGRLVALAQERAELSGSELPVAVGLADGSTELVTYQETVRALGYCPLGEVA